MKDIDPSTKYCELLLMLWRFVEELLERRYYIGARFGAGNSSMDFGEVGLSGIVDVVISAAVVIIAGFY